MEALIRTALKRPIATLLTFMGLVLLGILSLSSLRIEFLPDIVVPRLAVSTAYPGLGASEVRSLISIPLEDQLASVKGLKRISSVCRDGLSIITMEFPWGEDMGGVALRTREAIDGAFTSLPAGAEKPQVIPVDPLERPSALISVRPRNGDIEFARRLAEREIKARVQQEEGVGLIVLSGGLVDEVVVSLDQDLLATRGLRVTDVASLISRSNYDYPAGSITQGSQEVQVKTSGKVRYPEDLGEYHFSGDQSALKLSDVGGIAMAPRERESYFQVDGNESVCLRVMKRPGASPLALSRQLHSTVAALEQSYGKDVDIQIVYDSSLFITDSLRSLGFSILAGVIAAFLVLLFFLRDIRSAIFLMLSVPVVLSVCLVVLHVSGKSLNLMSLGGLALAIGLIVDNNVVVLENLKKRHRNEIPGTLSVLNHTRELVASRLGATLTLIVVFVPLVFLPGLLGALFTDLAITVLAAQIASFLCAITLMPVLFLISARTAGRPAKSFKKPVSERWFRLWFGRSLRHPVVLALGVGGLTIVGIAVSPLVGRDFLHSQDVGELDATLTMPYGTSLESSAFRSVALAHAIKSIPGVGLVLIRIGGEPDDLQYYADPEDRRELIHCTVLRGPGSKRSDRELARAITDQIHETGANLTVEPVPTLLAILLGDEKESSLLVTGPSPEEVHRRVDELLASLKSRDGSVVLGVKPEGQRSELRLIPDRDALGQAGLSLADLADSLQNGLSGSYPSRITLDGREIDVRVRLDKKTLSRTEDIPAMVIPLGKGQSARVADFAHLSSASAEPALYRVDRSDALTVTLRDVPGHTGAAHALATFASQQNSLSSPWIESVSASVVSENLNALLGTGFLVIVLLYLVLGAQFESFGLPLVLLIALPLAFSGIVIALALSGRPLSFDAILGIIVLFGIAVTNSIILYETCSARIVARQPVLSAVFQGTVDRLRPILMTMLITVFSLAPVAIDPWHNSAESGMATAIIGGLVVSSILTLFVIPRLFVAFFRSRATS